MQIVSNSIKYMIYTVKLKKFVNIFWLGFFIEFKLLYILPVKIHKILCNQTIYVNYFVNVCTFLLYQVLINIERKILT